MDLNAYNQYTQTLSYFTYRDLSSDERDAFEIDDWLKGHMMGHFDVWSGQRAWACTSKYQDWKVEESVCALLGLRFIESTADEPAVMVMGDADDPNFVAQIDLAQLPKGWHPFANRGILEIAGAKPTGGNDLRRELALSVPDKAQMRSGIKRYQLMPLPDMAWLKPRLIAEVTAASAADSHHNSYSDADDFGALVWEALSRIAFPAETWEDEEWEKWWDGDYPDTPQGRLFAYMYLSKHSIGGWVSGQQRVSPTNLIYKLMHTNDDEELIFPQIKPGGKLENIMDWMAGPQGPLPAPLRARADEQPTSYEQLSAYQLAMALYGEAQQLWLPVISLDSDADFCFGDLDIGVICMPAFDLAAGRLDRVQLQMTHM